MKQGSFRLYMTRLMGPWVVGFNQILTDSTNFIQTQVSSAYSSSQAASVSQAAALASQNATQTLEQQTAALQAQAQANADTTTANLAAIQAIIHTLNTIWLGTLSADPTVDGNGDPIPEGAMYLNDNSSDLSVYNHVRIYTDGAWENLDTEVQQEMSNAAASASKAAASQTAAATSATTATNASVTATTQAGIATQAVATIEAMFPTLSATVEDYYLRVNGSGSGFELRSPGQTLNDLGAAPILSPNFQGVPLVPTAAKNTNTTQAASVAFVLNQASSTLPLMNSGSGSIGTDLSYARGTHVHPTDTTRAAAGGSTTQQFTGSLFLAGWGVPNNGAPPGGYSFYNDGVWDTGMFSDGDGVLYLYNNSNRSIVLDANGNLTVNKTATFNGSVSVNSGIRVLGSGSEVDIFTRTTSSALYIQCGGNIFELDPSGNFTAPTSVVAPEGSFENGVIAGDIALLPTTFSAGGLGQGAVISWNSVGGSGSTDFINFKGLGSGGFKWWNTDPNTWAAAKNNTPTPLMNLDSTGRLTTTYVTANGSYYAPADSQNSFGCISMYAVNPYINLHKNNETAGIQIISYDPTKLSLRTLDGTNEFATFATIYWNLQYGAGLARLSGQNDGNLVVYTKSSSSATETAIWSVNSQGGIYNVPLSANSSVQIGGDLTQVGHATFQNDLYLPGISIRAAANGPRMTAETGGHFSFWDGSNNLVFYVATGDTTPSVNVLGTLNVTGGNVVAAGITLNNGGTSSIYQDSNTNNIVFHVKNGSTDNYYQIETDGTFNIQNVNGNTGGYIQGGRILAEEGAPGTMAGFSFINDGNYDTGMFSSGDGQLSLYTNNTQVMSMSGGSINVTGGTLTMTGGDIIMPTRRIRTSTGSNMYFESGGNISFWDSKGNEIAWFDLSEGGNGLVVNTKLSLNGVLSATSLSVPNGNSSTLGPLELYASTPYIDFHYNNTTADYSTRIINDGASQLTFMAGTARFSGNIAGTGNAVDIVYGPNNLYEAAFQNDGNFVLYQNNNSFFSVKPGTFWTNASATFGSSVSAQGGFSVNDTFNSYCDIFMNGNSIRSANGGARMTVEAGGHFSFWDKNNNLIFWVGTNDASPNVNVNGSFYVNGGSISTAGITLNNGGTSSIYQDSNTNNIVFHVKNGSTDNYYQIESDGTFNIQNVNGNTGGYLQGGRILANEGLPGAMAGFTFIQEGDYDTGMFSDGDGLLYFYRNGSKLISLGSDNNVTVNTLLNMAGGDIILANRRIWGGSGTSGNNSNMYFEGGGHISIYDNANNLIWWWAMSDGNAQSINSNYPMNINGLLTASQLSLPKDSASNVGNFNIYAANPFINFWRNADNGGLTAVLISDGSAQLSIRDGAENTIASFNDTDSNFYYQTRAHRFSLQNDGNAVFYKGTTAFASIRDDASYFRMPTTFTGNLTVTGGNVIAAGITLNNGGSSSVYQDSNTNDVVFQVGSQYPKFIDSVSGAALYIGEVISQRTLANEGLPGSQSGYSFNGDGDFDTGMFSDGDGALYMYSNSNRVLTLTSGSVSFDQGITVNGTITGTGDVVCGNGKWLYADSINSKSSGSINFNSPVNALGSITLPNASSVYITSNQSNSATNDLNQTARIIMTMNDRSTNWTSQQFFEEQVGVELRQVIYVGDSGGSNYYFRFSNNGRIDANTFNGNAVTANYADLAENYKGDEDLISGTFVKINDSDDDSDDREVVKMENQDDYCAGVISTDPAFLMNKGQEGSRPVALVGRVPALIKGPVRKGHKIQLSDIPGVGEMGDAHVIGVALETNLDEGIKLVEIFVGGR